MKRFRYLLHLVIILTGWCLFATNAQADFYYDSSFQRSKFLKGYDGESNYVNLLMRSIDEKRTRILWDVGMMGESLTSDGNIQSRTAGFTSNVKFRYRLIASLQIRADAKLQMQAGRTQSLFGDLEPDSGVYIRDAKVRFAPFNNQNIELKIDGGVISQSDLDNPLLIKKLGFPGAKESFFITNSKNFTVGVFAQQLIPTSSTLSTRVQDREPLPTFYTESAEAFMKISNWNWARFRFTLFNYNDLPSNVAYQSQRLGNTFPGLGGEVNNSVFMNDFDGWMSQFYFEQKLSDGIAGQLQIDQIRNQAAPDTLNESLRLEFALAIDTGRWILIPAFEKFFIEPDAVPAFYNDWLRGHNNREGWGAGFALESKDNNFKAGINYFNAGLLNKGEDLLARDVQQDNLRTIMLTLETAYDAI